MNKGMEVEEKKVTVLASEDFILLIAVSQGPDSIITEQNKHTILGRRKQQETTLKQTKWRKLLIIQNHLSNIAQFPVNLK